MKTKLLKKLRKRYPVISNRDKTKFKLEFNSFIIYNGEFYFGSTNWTSDINFILKFRRELILREIRH